MPNRQQAIIWTNADPIHWCIYVAQGGDELNTVPVDGLATDGTWPWASTVPVTITKLDIFCIKRLQLHYKPSKCPGISIYLDISQHCFSMISLGQKKHCLKIIEQRFFDLSTLFKILNLSRYEIHRKFTIYFIFVYVSYICCCFAAELMMTLRWCKSEAWSVHMLNFPNKHAGLQMKPLKPIKTFNLVESL